jgi:hypothetical protein
MLLSKNFKWQILSMLLVLISLTLVACGGGGGDSPAGSPTNISGPFPSPLVPGATVPAPGNAAVASVDPTPVAAPAPGSSPTLATVSPVTQLLIAPESRTQIKLTWQAPTDSASYVIYRKLAGSADSYVQVAAPAAAARSYTDADLTSATRYTYRLVRKIAAIESAPADATQSPYSPPIVITQGGIYSGNWDNTGTGARDAAVEINTDQLVIIENSYIRSPRYGIDSRAWNANIVVRKTYGVGVNPNVVGLRKASFVNVEEFASVTLENNWIEGYQAGLRAMNFDANTKANRSGQVVNVRYNQVRNVDGRESDGNGGYRFANSRAGQAFGLNSVNRGIADIAWNEIINLPFQSETEDIISTYNSGGTASAPMQIRFNYVQGAYHSDVAAAVNYSGVVINLGDCEVNGNPNITACEYVSAFNNRVVSFSNKGIDMIGGRNMRAYNNRAVSAQRAPDGTVIGATSRHGLGFWNIYNNPNWANNLMYDNYAKVVGASGNAGGSFFGPNNISFSAANYYNNADQVAGTQYQIATNPATRADEQAEYVAWKLEAANAGIALGPQRCTMAGSTKICQ